MHNNPQGRAVERLVPHALGAAVVPYVAVLLAVLSGCSRPAEDAWQVVDSSGLTREERELKDRAHAARDELAQRLKGRLLEELAESGPVGAVTVCSREAAAIADTVSSELGVRVGRTSHRRRSPNNTPPVWAKSLVTQRIESPTYVRTGGGLNALLPIRVGGECLLCHGDTAAMPASLVAAIDAAYPKDAARGFSEGDLRGWFWVECEAGPQNTPTAATGTMPDSSASSAAPTDEQQNGEAGEPTIAATGVIHGQGLCRLSVARPHEAQQVVFLERFDVDLVPQREASVEDLLTEDLFARSDVAHQELPRHPRDTLEVDHDETPARLEASVDRGERTLRALEVVVGVADENEVDRLRSEADGVVRAEHRRKVEEAVRLCALLNVFQELGSDIDSVHPAMHPDRLREELAVEARSGADIRDALARPQTTGFKHLRPSREHLATLHLKAADPLVDIEFGVLETRVDPFGNDECRFLADRHPDGVSKQQQAHRQDDRW